MSNVIEDMENDKPLVAIKCLVYNHEPYLRGGFEGFVMQKTNFRFIVVAHDDASTDGSAAIIREYAEKYPEIFRPIYETENQYSKHDGSLTRIMNEACKGAKYIASCEGDDYWTDPLKLQKQLDFLESHPDFVACCTRYQYYYLNTKKYDIDHFEGLFDNGQEGIEYNHDNYFEIGRLPQVLTMMYRADTFPPDAYYHKLKNGQDDAMYYCMTLYGKIWLMNEVTGVYRKHDYSLTWHVSQGGAIAQAKMLHDIWLDCWQYDKSDVLRGTVLWSIQRWCTSTIRYAKKWEKNIIRQCIEEHKSIASKSEQRSFYKAIFRALIVRLIKRPYKKC